MIVIHSVSYDSFQIYKSILTCFISNDDDDDDDGMVWCGMEIKSTLTLSVHLSSKLHVTKTKIAFVSVKRWNLFGSKQ